MTWAVWSAVLAAGAIGATTVSAMPVYSFADPRITESSGLVDLGSLMVTTNDSGGDPLVFVLDSTTGRTVATTTFADQVEDVEALAPAGDGSVWVGDIGDNRLVRTSVQVYRVPVGDRDRTVSATSYDLVYPDGSHDAESLVYGQDSRLRIITKDLLGGRVYVAPKNLDPDRPNRLVAGPAVDLWATDAALFPDGRHVLVRGYGGALVATYPGFSAVGEFALPDQDQGEGVSIGGSGRIRLSSEGTHSSVLQIRLPEEVRSKMAAAGGSGPREGLDSEGIIAAERASGLRWRPLAVGAAGVVCGWILVRRLRRKP